MQWGEMSRCGQRSMVTRNRRRGRPGCLRRVGRSYAEAENAQAGEASRPEQEAARRDVNEALRVVGAFPAGAPGVHTTRAFLFWQLSQLLHCAVTANCRDGTDWSLCTARKSNQKCLTPLHVECALQRRVTWDNTSGMTAALSGLIQGIPLI